MSATLIIKDGISPKLRKMLKGIKPRGPVLKAMGTVVVEMGRQAFSMEDRRPTAWPPRKPRKGDGGHPLLVKSGTLRRGLRVVKTSERNVTIGSDRAYAAVHQLGSRKTSGRGSGIPARPFLPIINGKLTPRAAAAIEMVIKKKAGVP